jgi:macrodomain Ter protein organizer (MatP/YcbG family)
MDQSRDKKGHFANKGEEKREVRSIRLTDSAWQKLGELATERGITRADFIEEMMSINNQPVDFVNNQKVIGILKSALKLKANAGGAIKEEIKKVLLLLT